MGRRNSEGRYAEPKRSLILKPHSNSVYFAGKFINLASIAIKVGVSTAAVSLIFSGKRNPSFKTAKKIANALNMDLHIFARLLDAHVTPRRLREAEKAS